MEKQTCHIVDSRRMQSVDHISETLGTVVGADKNRARIQNLKMKLKPTMPWQKVKGPFQLRLRWRFRSDFEEVAADQISIQETLHIPNEFTCLREKCGSGSDILTVTVTNDRFIIRCQFCQDVYRFHKSDLGTHFRTTHAPTSFLDEHL